MIFLKWRNGCTYCTSTIDSSAIIKRCRIVYFGNFLGGLGEFGMQRPIPYLTIILCLLMISSTWDIIAYQISRKYSACASLSLAAPATLAALSLGHSWMRAALASHSVSTISPKSFSSNSFRRSSYLVSLYIYIYWYIFQKWLHRPHLLRNFCQTSWSFSASFPWSKCFQKPQRAWHYITNPNYFKQKSPKIHHTFAASLISPPQKKMGHLWWLLYQPFP